MCAAPSVNIARSTRPDVFSRLHFLPKLHPTSPAAATSAMSLINDALKRAQNLQSRGPGGTPAFPRATAAGGPASPLTSPTQPPAPNADATTATPLRKGKSTRTGLLVGIVISVLFVGMGALGYVVYAVFFTRSPADEITQATKTAPDVVQPADPVPNPSSSSTPATNGAPGAAAPAAPTGVPSPTADPGLLPATANPAPGETTPAATQNPAHTAPAPEPEPVEVHVNNPSPAIQVWVSKIVVAGIRGGARPKALMNDRVYLIGDTVSPENGLKLFKIGDRELVFQDAEGNTYDYRF